MNIKKQLLALIHVILHKCNQKHYVHFYISDPIILGGDIIQ